MPHGATLHAALLPPWAALRWRGTRGLSNLGPWCSQPPALSSKPHLLMVNINIQKQSSPVPQFPYLCKSLVCCKHENLQSSELGADLPRGWDTGPLPVTSSLPNSACPCLGATGDGVRALPSQSPPHQHQETLAHRLAPGPGHSLGHRTTQLQHVLAKTRGSWRPQQIREAPLMSSEALPHEGLGRWAIPLTALQEARLRVLGGLLLKQTRG